MLGEKKLPFHHKHSNIVNEDKLSLNNIKKL